MPGDKLGLLNSIANTVEQGAQKLGKPLMVDPSLVKLPPQQQQLQMDPNAGVSQDDKMQLAAKRAKAMQALQQQGIDPATGEPMEQPQQPAPSFNPSQGLVDGLQMARKGRR